MKKGVGVIIPMIIILALMLLAEYFIVGYIFRSEYLIGRFLKEVPILQEGEKVETYVRSFNNAITLSILESVYENKDNSGNLWQDYNSGTKRYVSQIPDKNSIDVSINDSANMYLNGFKEFRDGISDDISLPDEVSIKNIVWDNKWISTEFESVAFYGERGNIEIDRVFNPKGRLATRFSKIWDLADDIILDINNEFQSLSISETDCTVADVNGKIDAILSSKKTNFNSNPTFKDKIELKDLSRVGDAAVTVITSGGSFQCCQFNTIVHVKMDDIKNDDEMEREFPVYDGSDLKLDYLGLIYRFKSGNANVCYICVNAPDCSIASCCPGYKCCPIGICVLTSSPCPV